MTDLLQRKKSPRPVGSRRVLVVDDDRDTTDSLAILLQLWGHEVHTSENGQGALAVAKEVQPEVVLLDIGLPGLSGFEVAVQLRVEKELAGTLLIAVTGYDQESNRQRAFEAGFDLYLVKPVDLDELRQLIASAPLLPARRS